MVNARLLVRGILTVVMSADIYYAETKSCDIEEKREINIIAVQQDLMQSFVNDHGERCTV
jgi:hypothetical protein